MSRYTVDPDTLATAGTGNLVRDVAGMWSGVSRRVASVAHLDGGAGSAAAAFGSACDTALAAVLALADTLDRMLVSAGDRYAGTDRAAVRR